MAYEDVSDRGAGNRGCVVADSYSVRSADIFGGHLFQL